MEDEAGHDSRPGVTDQSFIIRARAGQPATLLHALALAVVTLVLTRRPPGSDPD